MRGLMPAVFPREGADPQEIRRRKSAVAVASGRAAEATALTHTYWGVAGHPSPVDPIASWSVIVDPKPLIEPQHIFESCDQIQGRLHSMILKAKAELPPTIGVAEMHPLIWSAARPLWQARSYRHAVAAAAGALIEQVKIRTGRNDVPETSLWQQVFSNADPEPNKPRLRWPGSATDNDVKNTNDGLRQERDR